MTEYEPIAGSINKLANADRATIQAMVSTYTLDKEELVGWLYELVAAAYVKRDSELMLGVVRLIAEIRGWIQTPAASDPYTPPQE